jgi:hypothetical protein
MKTMTMKDLLGTTLACAVAALAVTSAGCAASYERTDVSDVSQSDLPSTVSLTNIRVTEGALTTAHVIPYNTDGNPLNGEVRSDNPKILDCTRATGNKWAFLGVSKGTTTVNFLADGQVVGRVTAEVTAQP